MRDRPVRLLLPFLLFWLPLSVSAFDFEPLAASAVPGSGDPARPWRLPDGLTARRLLDETRLDLYPGEPDWTDMLASNETGIDPGRYLYRTHEVRRHPLGAAVSVVDLRTGEARLFARRADWRALDGIRWTPWGTLLVGEEVSDGRVFELFPDPRDPMRLLRAVERPALGRMAHEGIEVDPQGRIYLVDEHRGGGLYRFVPARRGDLSAGRLEVLGLVGGGRDGTGQGRWLGPVDPRRARRSARRLGAAAYQRPEDLERIGTVLYAAITEGPRDARGRERWPGRVLAIDLESLRVRDFVVPGRNVPRGDRDAPGLERVDNLAESPEGRLLLVEDHVPSDVWVADPGGDDAGLSPRVRLFASLADPHAEGTGIHFVPGVARWRLFVNQQHSRAPGGDATWVIEPAE